MTTETFLTPQSLEVLRGLVGAQLRAYGTDLELDDGVGAFGAWLDTDRGTVELEFVEQVIDFPAGERVESVLEARPGVADGDAHELGGTIRRITRIQDKVAQIDKLDNTLEWEWWRDSGLRFHLDSGQELLIHCASPVVIEVRMQAGPAGSLGLSAPGRIYQEGEKRRYEYAFREVPLVGEQ